MLLVPIYICEDIQRKTLHLILPYLQYLLKFYMNAYNFKYNYYLSWISSFTEYVFHCSSGLGRNQNTFNFSEETAVAFLIMVEITLTLGHFDSIYIYIYRCDFVPSRQGANRSQ